MKKLFIIAVFLCLITIGLSQNYVASVINDENLEIQVETSSPTRTQEYLFRIKNISFSTISMLWDESSITGFNNAPSKMILKDNVNFLEYPQAETIIEPGQEIIVTIIPLNTITDKGIEVLELTERTVSLFFQYLKFEQKESIAARIKFPVIKEQSTFDKVFPWVMAGAGAALVLGIIFWPRN
ncbi:MAG TPA: hypothetical protein PLI77_02550 [Bacteroidales bacterium]|nr:hypothetical protein [Bacteroidales bacterium]HPJ12734.1 hypothetical protein [Caldisericia bacterium]HRW33695.1 hypothetical protein [Thermotogota bacterium]